MRGVLFYVLLLLPTIVWMAIVAPNYLPSTGLVEFSATIVSAAVAISPLIGGDISVFGEITPIVLAGLIIGLMPQSKQINYLAVGLAILSYFLFLQLSVFFSSGPGVGLLADKFDSIVEPQKVILNLVSNVRVMSIVVSAAILGFKIKR